MERGLEVDQGNREKIIPGWILFLMILLLFPTMVFASESNLYQRNAIIDSTQSLPDIPDGTDPDNRVVVIYKEQNDKNIESLELDASQVQAAVSLTQAVDVLVPSNGQNAHQLMADIGQKGGVAAVFMDKVISIQSVNNGMAKPFDDPLIQKGGMVGSTSIASSMYVFDNTGACYTWDKIKSNDTVEVAVIDSGCVSGMVQLDLKERMASTLDLYGKDKPAYAGEDLSGHGTEVAGCIAAQINNGIGTAGITGEANVQVVPYRCGGQYAGDSKLYLSNIVAALKDITENHPEIKIINMSFGVQDDDSASVESTIEAMRKPVAEAQAAGKILIAAAGNGGSTRYMYPASFDGVISVGAVDSNNERCTFSNYNDKVTVVAPGYKVVTTTMANPWFANANGTSFAAPYVSGEAAMLLAKDPDLTAAEVKKIIETTTMDIGAAGKDNEYGFGLIRFDTAYDYLDDGICPLGDIDLDGIINAADALSVLRYSVKEISLQGEALTRGDVTKDGSINASDALQILRYSVKEIDEF